MTTNKLFILLLIITLCGCESNAKKGDVNRFVKNIKLKDKYVSAQNIFDSLEYYSNKQEYDLCYKFIDRLISYNKRNGLLYYDRAGIDIAVNNYKSALADFNIALNLNYDRDKCLMLIQYCKQRMDDKN
jgi:tetratricopeptide (TPR) repeat protein